MLSQGELRKFLRRWLAISALVITLGAFWAVNEDNGLRISARDFANSALPDAAVVLVAYLVTRQWLARKGLSEADDLELAVARHVAKIISPVPGIMSLGQAVSDHPWRELIDRSSKTLDIVGRFFDAPIHEIGLDRLQSFYDRGGRIRAMIYDPSDRAAVGVVSSQWNSETGKKLHPEDVASRLLTSIKLLENARLEAGAPEDAVQIMTVPAVNYAAYCFDDRDLIIVPYAEATKYSAPPPRFHIDLTIASTVRDFWRHEWSSITAGERGKARTITAAKFLASHSMTDAQSAGKSSLSNGLQERKRN